jgi:hypothetical protein
MEIVNSDLVEIESLNLKNNKLNGTTTRLKVFYKHYII